MTALAWPPPRPLEEEETLTEEWLEAPLELTATPEAWEELPFERAVLAALPRDLSSRPSGRILTTSHSPSLGALGAVSAGLPAKQVPARTRNADERRIFRLLKEGADQGSLGGGPDRLIP